MGSCCACRSVEAIDINGHLRDAERNQSRTFKLLLCGPTASGKSTIMQQFEHLSIEDHQHDTHKENTNYWLMKKRIRYKCVSSLIELLHKSDLLSNEPHKLEECMIDFNNPTIEYSIKVVFKFNENADDGQIKTQDAEELAELGTVTYFSYVC